MAYTPYHTTWHDADSVTGGGDTSTPVEAAALTHIEAGIVAAADDADDALALAEDAIPAPSPVTNGPVYWNGSAWVSATLKDAQIASDAALSVSKLAPGSSNQFLGVTGSTATWKYPPGYEIGATSITAEVSVTATAQSAGNLVMSGGALSFDGTAVVMEWFFPYVRPPKVSGGYIWLMLYESAAYVTRIGIVSAGATTADVFWSVAGRYRFTPSAATHTYQIYAYVSSGTGLVGAGAGTGADTYVPATLRFLKA